MMAIDKGASLTWAGEGDIFTGGIVGGPTVILDGGGGVGPSPVIALLLSLAACMAVDIRMILEKSRVPLQSLETEIDWERAAEPPRRLTRVRMVFQIAGPQSGDEGKVRRAVDLSRDTYCSVLHSLRSDIVIETEIRLA